jgi:hypothetical protein
VSTLWIAGAIIGIIVLRRISPVAGSAFAVVVTLVIAGWGAWTYNQGGGVGLVFSNQRVPEPAFFAVIGLWFAIEVYGLVRNVRRRARSAEEE